MSLENVLNTENQPQPVFDEQVDDIASGHGATNRLSEETLTEHYNFVDEDLIASSTICHIAPDSNSHSIDAHDLSFLVSEDSIVLSESKFDCNLATETTVSASYDHTKDLPVSCDDSLGSSVHDSLPSNLLSYGAQHGIGMDFLATTAEEASMDSGLGSVESTYPNSEDDSVVSPQDDNVVSPQDDSNENNSIISPQMSSVVHDQQEIEEYRNTDTVELASEINCDIKGASKETFNCTSTTVASQLKRPHEDGAESSCVMTKKCRKEKKVDFQDVTVFYFPRKQGFVSVPSQGGSTLGMAMQHFEHSTMSLWEHGINIKARHEEKIREHIREQKLNNKIKQLQYMNPELDSRTLSSMAQAALRQADEEQRFVAGEENTSHENYDEFFFLQPISAKKRRKMLRLAGVDRIDGEEKLMNRLLRESREMCGCNCERICVPETCECAQAGIQCQVDRESFPCGCVASGCQNENGRVEFDSERVRAHLLATLERLRELQHDAGSSEEAEFSSDDTEQSVVGSISEESAYDHQELENESVDANLERDSGPRQPSELSDIIPQNFLQTLQLKRVTIDLDLMGNDLRDLTAGISCDEAPHMSNASALSTSCHDFDQFYPFSAPLSSTYVQSTTTSSSVSAEQRTGSELSITPQILQSSNSEVSFHPDQLITSRCDQTVSLDPIDVFMSPTYITTSSVNLNKK